MLRRVLALQPLWLLPHAVPRVLLPGMAASMRRPRAAGWRRMAAAAVSGAASLAAVAVASQAQSQPHLQAEQLYLTDRLKVYDYIKNYLANGGQPTAELLWRFARACHHQAEEISDKNKKKALINEGFEAAQKALSMDDKIAGVHKWMAIMYSDLGDFTSLKEKLLNAFKMKDHFVRALELDPKDATARHLLGVWCFTFADLAWYERKAAATFFATPPTSNYEQALSHFQAAENMDPGFYPKNALYLGKTLLRMGRKAEAKEWLQKCLNMAAANADDRAAHDEARTLLSSTG